MATLFQSPIELWGGLECTINRVGDRFFNQLEYGPPLKPSDLDRIAELGIRTLRFPVLWEQLAPVSLQAIDWSWADSRLSRLRELGMNPIAGLVHHGSGPAYTNLLDPEFPQKLAQYARLVAERYPWIEAFTPVNEPLTTARFSGLYGLWFPHARDKLSFARALLNQCRGVVLAMRAIREIIPHARLIQPDDLGKTYGTPKLQYQADFDNERRWLTWDLLCGKVTPDHRMWQYLSWAGISAAELEIFLREPCPPDVIGINHYVTSDRFLDDNVRAYPPETHGGNERDRYADVAAVRVRIDGICPLEELLQEASARYQRPIAVTEAHLGCSREEQVRWLDEIWKAAARVRAEGVDIRAVTAWSLFGAYDWNSLLTRQEGYYEPGAFDLRGGMVRPTAIAKTLRHLAGKTSTSHPLLAQGGWWRRDIRYTHQPRHSSASRPFPTCAVTPFVPIDHRPILITGGGGKLAGGFTMAAERRGLNLHVLRRRDFELSDAGGANEAMKTVQPWAVIHCAGVSRDDGTGGDSAACMRDNLAAVAHLAHECAEKRLPFICFSSDFVFDGAKAAPYLESDPVRPLGIYGESKVQMERSVATLHPRALILRCGELLSTTDPSQFLTSTMRSLSRGQRVPADCDAIFSLTYLPDVIEAALDLLIDDESGIWHLAHHGGANAADLLRRAAELAKLDAHLIDPLPLWNFNPAAERPRDRVLRSERAELLPPLNDALRRYVIDSQLARATVEEKTLVAH